MTSRHALERGQEVLRAAPDDRLGDGLAGPVVVAEEDEEDLVDRVLPGGDREDNLIEYRPIAREVPEDHEEDGEREHRGKLGGVGRHGGGVYKLREVARVGRAVWRGGRTA